MHRVTDIAALVDQLTLDEKAALTAGSDHWSTVEVARLGIPRAYLSDGPNGARGAVVGPAGASSVCVPCGSALGATWDPALLTEVGALLGREARRKQARVLLAPTVNIPRSPLAGRSFECYAEDPVLSGLLAAAFIRGAQGEGVATTVKHLVGNDAEFERYGISSVIDERALRELYLRPFELAVREGRTLGLMTSYNRLNGSWLTEQAGILAGIVREEWGFEGFVVTDWYGVLDTRVSSEAGVDLEMPGPARSFGPALAEAVRSGEADESLLDAQVTRLLTVLDRVGALDDPLGAEHVEEAVDLPTERALTRRAATDSMVLLANDGLLPLDPEHIRTLAVVGPNAAAPTVMGGGSASLRSHPVTGPVEALRARLGDGTRVVTEPGCHNHKLLPPLGGAMTAAPSGAGPGFDIEFHAGPGGGGDIVDVLHVPIGEWFALGQASPEVPATGWSLRARTVLTVPESGAYELGLTQVAAARLLVDGEVVVDGSGPRPPRGEAYFGVASIEMTATVDLDADRPVELVVEYEAGDRPGAAGFRVGGSRLADDDLMDRAVAAAAEADAVVVVVGTTGEWETEGHDRASLALPGDQDELVRRVAAANPATVVVVNSGAPVAMGWAAGLSFTPTSGPDLIAAATLAAASVIGEAGASDPDLDAAPGPGAGGLNGTSTAAAPGDGGTGAGRGGTDMSRSRGRAGGSTRLPGTPAAVLQAWFGGQEMGEALAEVLLGEAEPAGRLPVTLPERVEHTPAYGNFPGENGEVRYGEGLLVGYRWYDARHLPPRFPFGHGLSYTSWEIGRPTLSSPAFRPGETLVVEVPVTNTGHRRGAEVVQCYVAPPAGGRLSRPPKELRAFAKAWLEPGESATVRLELDDRAFAAWDPGQADRPQVDARMTPGPLRAGRRRRAPGWYVDPGPYRVLIARSAAAVTHDLAVDVLPAG